MGYGTVGLGLLMMLFPFATPETVRLIGLSHAILVVRLLGLMTVALGVAVVLALGSR